MEIFLKDVSEQILSQEAVGIYDDGFIHIKAYSINNRAECKAFRETEKNFQTTQKTLIGETTVSTGLFRQLNDTDIKLHVQIPIPSAFDKITEIEGDDKDEENAASNSESDVDEF